MHLCSTVDIRGAKRMRTARKCRKTRYAQTRVGSLLMSNRKSFKKKKRIKKSDEASYEEGSPAAYRVTSCLKSSIFICSRWEERDVSRSRFSVRRVISKIARSCIYLLSFIKLSAGVNRLIALPFMLVLLAQEAYVLCCAALFPHLLPSERKSKIPQNLHQIVPSLVASSARTRDWMVRLILCSFFSIYLHQMYNTISFIIYRYLLCLGYSIEFLGNIFNEYWLYYICSALWNFNNVFSKFLLNLEIWYIFYINKNISILISNI